MRKTHGATPLLLLLLASIAIAGPSDPGPTAWPSAETSPPHWAWHNWTFGDSVGYLLFNTTFTPQPSLINVSTDGWILSPDADSGGIVGSAGGEGRLFWSGTAPANTTLTLAVAGTAGNLSAEWSAATWVVVSSGGLVPPGFRYYRWNVTMSSTLPPLTPTLTSVSLQILANQAPTAIAPADFSAPRNTTVSLDGSGSNDADNDTLVYSWVQVLGPPVALLGNATPIASFFASSDGTYTFSLNVSDGLSYSVDSVLVAVMNSAPVADAGADQVAVRNVTVVLNGSASTDLNSDPLYFLWSLAGGPDAVPIAGPDQAITSFVPTGVGTYVFDLSVGDGQNTSLAVTQVTVVDQAPSSAAGADLTAFKDDLVSLNGTNSSDPDGDPLMFSWTQTGGPLAVTLVGNTTASPSFTAPTGAGATGAYRFQLNVSDAFGSSTVDTVAVNVSNRAPNASAGTDQGIAGPGITVFLDGLGSGDPDNESLIFAWSQASGTFVAVNNATAAVADFLAIVGGTYSFLLQVTDPDGATAQDLVTITVAPGPNRAPLAVITASGATGNLSTVFVFDASGSSDPDNDTLAVTWDFGDGNISTGAVASHAYGRRGLYTVTGRVDDGSGGNDTATLEITVGNRAPSVTAEDRVGTVGEALFLTANGTDDDGDALTYTWRVLSAPGNSTLSGNGTARFLGEAAGVFLLEVTVDDGFGGNVSATILVTLTATTGGGTGPGGFLTLWPLFLLLLVAAALAGGVGYEPNRVRLLTLFLVPLYTRRLRDDPDLEVRGMIQGYLKAHPGDTYTDIKRILGLNNGAVAWHLMKLEKEGVIKIHVRGGRRRYYPREIALPQENGGELHEVQRRLLRAVEQDPGLAVGLLAEKMGMSSQLALYHLRKLTEKGYVNLERRALQLCAFPGARAPAATDKET